jgi:probable rRNA maturation factor
MGEPPSPTGAATVVVVGADEQDEVSLDVDRWTDLARRVLAVEGRHGELTLTFVDRDEIAALNREHLGKEGPTDVLSFPLDAAADAPAGADVPTLLGDVVVCPGVAAEQAPDHAGTLDDELALLVVHGVLHVIGHDHAERADADRMRARELDHLQRLHWHGPVPAGFRQEHDGEEGSR